MKSTTLNKNLRASFGSYETSIAEWIEKASKQSLVKRLWDKDATLWKKDVASHKDIRSRLGWLALPKTMPKSVSDIVAFADEIKGEFQHVVLLGMGGSSLAPEVFQATFGNKEGYPSILVLDSTDPARVADLDKSLTIEKTLFIVSSKSGGTIELLSFFKYFHGKLLQKKGAEAGKHFIAITDPGTPLVEMAKQHSFRRIFLAPEDVGGRFSALTYFGLVPAALIGIDIQKILESAAAMADASGADKAAAENPSLVLGVAMAVLAEEGRDKLTIVAPRHLDSFGDWAEQLVAESTGKEDSGIVPIVREPLGKPSVYGADRFFVVLADESKPDAALEAGVAALEKAGHPVLTLSLGGVEDLGGEFFRWEMATVVACALLKVNAFDQPDVQAAKDKAKLLLKTIEEKGSLPPRESTVTLETFWEDIEEGDYVSILAFLPDRPEIKKKLSEIQLLIRNQMKLAVTVGYGPRYLHSTGQLHKGGSNKGVFILVTSEQKLDLPIPGEKYSFAQLELAQAMGDFDALESKGRWLVHVRLPGFSQAELDTFGETVKKTLKAKAANDKELANN